MKNLFMLALFGVGFQALYSAESVYSRWQDIIASYLRGDNKGITNQSLSKHLTENYPSLSREDRFLVKNIIERYRELKYLPRTDSSGAAGVGAQSDSSDAAASGGGAAGVGAQSDSSDAAASGGGAAGVAASQQGGFGAWLPDFSNWLGWSSQVSSVGDALLVGSRLDVVDSDASAGGAAGGGGAAYASQTPSAAVLPVDSAADSSADTKSPEDFFIDYFVNGDGARQELKNGHKFSEVFNQKALELGIEKPSAKQELVKLINDARRQKSS